MKYLDYAATTPIDHSVLELMTRYLSTEYGNASSVHTFGREARMAVERSRQQVATVFGAQQKEIVFTSSASESNNLAIKGVIEQIRAQKLLYSDLIPEIIASSIEHPCVIETLKHLESLGWAKIVWIPVDIHGIISVESITNAITDNTILVSVMYVNNEIGCVMPVVEIGAAIKKIRKYRSQSNNHLPIYFHCDAVQAVQYFDCNVDSIAVDLMSATSHKLYGPKGVGILYVRNGIQLTRQIDGGGQEYYLRAGTENVPGIVGAGHAFSLVQERREHEFSRLIALQNDFYDLISQSNLDYHITGSRSSRAPHISSIFLHNVDSEALIIGLDRMGFAVSSGSACSSGVVRQSHVIHALSIPQEVLKQGSALRISTGRETTLADLKEFIQALTQVCASVKAFV